jgi:hypothetical protein
MNTVPILFAGVLTLAASACYATVEPEPVGYAYVTSAPADVETYPSVYYEGRPVYYYGDHWWFRDGSRWGYYRSEPEYLHRQRSYVQQAPPAHRAAPRVEERREAPPAERVR